MKKKLLVSIAVLTITIVGVFAFIPTQAQSGVINPDCPNGCHDGGTGCECNGWHRHDREHVWPQ